MGHHVVRHILFPIFCFVGFVSVGFAAWAFNDSVDLTLSMTGSVNVTALRQETGLLEIYEPATPTTMDEYASLDYTMEDSYYTLVFEEDQTLDPTVGVTLYPSISYTFSDFRYPHAGYSYYLNFRTEYSATTSTTDSTYDTQGLYSKYVTMTDAYLSESGTDATTGLLYQTSIPIALDVSSATVYRTETIEGVETNFYTYQGTFSPSFRWKNNSKPTTRAAYNAFLGEVEAKAADTFTIVMWITYS